MKPSNININLTSGIKKPKTTAAAGNLVASARLAVNTVNDDKTIGAEAFTEPSNEKRYIALQRKGLNNLRSEIIAVTEFIPLSTGDMSEKSTKINKKLGENTTVSVTNMARLLELHRQIRNYTFSASNLVFQKLYPDISSNEFLNWLDGKISLSFKTLAKPTLDLTIAAVYDHIIESEQGEQVFLKTVNDNKNNTFFRLVIEYFIYKNLVDEVVNYTGDIANLSNLLKKYWAINNFRLLKTFSPSSALENADNLVQNIFTGTSSLLLNSEKEIDKELLGIKNAGENSDIDILAGAAMQLASLMTFRDSSLCLSTLGKLESNDQLLSVPSGKNKIGVQSDLADSISKIKNVSITGFISALGSNTEAERTGTLESEYNPSEKLTGDKLFDIFKLTKEADGTINTSVKEGAKELMVALSYDLFSYKAQNNLKSNLDKLNYLSSGGVSNDEKKDLYHYYISKVIAGTELTQLKIKGKDDNTSTSNIFLDRKSVPAVNGASYNGGWGSFLTEITGIKANNDLGVNFVPLESLETSIPSGTITGMQNFIDTEKENPNSVSSINQYSKMYKEKSNELLTDVLTLFPSPDITKELTEQDRYDTQLRVLASAGYTTPKSIFTDLLYELGSSLAQVLGEIDNKNHSHVPVLAALLSSYGHTNQYLKMFLGGAWPALIFGNSGKISNHQKAVGITDNTYKKVYGRFIEYYNEATVGSFFKYHGLTPREKGSDATVKFKGGSGKKYKLYLGDTNNLFTKDEVKNKFNSGKIINGFKRAKDLPEDGDISNFKISAKKIDNKFNQSFGGNRELEYIRDGDRTTTASTPEIGIHRIFDSYFNAVCLGAYTSQDKKFEYVKYDDNDNPENPLFKEGGKPRKKGFTGSIGSIIGFETHQRLLISFQWAYQLIRNVTQIKMYTDSDGNLTFKIYKDQLKGLVNALLEKSERESKKYTITDSDNYRQAYDYTVSYIDSTLEKFDIRQRMITDTAALFSAHADSLTNYSDKIQNVFNGTSVESIGGTNSVNDVRKLTVTILKDKNILNDIIDLNVIDSALNMKKYRLSGFSMSNTGYQFKSDELPLSKFNFSEKVLSTSGYGFLKSEKAGNKSIVNIGIPNSMLETLRKRAFRETKNNNYLNTPYVCISLFKKDHLNPEYVFYPKNYIFDTSLDILDHDPTNPTELANHLKNFTHDMTFEKLIETVDTCRYYFDVSGKIKLSKKRGSASTFSRQVLINHIHDYVFKFYNKISLGMNLNENTFLLTRDNTIEMSSLARKEYNIVLGEIKRLYPAIESDPDLKSEVFRLVNAIKQSAPFSYDNRFVNLISPKSFDKVYSIFVNEKDFVLANDDSIFVPSLTNYSFNINCGLVKPNTHDMDDVYKKYKQSLQENSPEVYNYYCQVTILPIGFSEGAIDYTTSESKLQSIVQNIKPAFVGSDINIQTTSIINAKSSRSMFGR